MITPEEYDKKKKEIETSYWNEVDKIEKKYDVKDVSNMVGKEVKKNDPENVKKAIAECENCAEKHKTEVKNLRDKFVETYNKLVDDSENYQKLKSNKGDKNMESKDEKEIESVFKKLLEKENKNSKFENTINDIHSKISKIDSIEKGLVDIIPKVQKIDSICEDGKCFKTELADIKKDLAETKKGKISAEICPECGLPGLMHSETFLASNCSNCGEPIQEWTNDDGTPIVGWKNYKLRGK